MRLNRREWLSAVALALAAGRTARAQAQQAAVKIDVFKTPTCGCCSVWVEHLKRNGFAPTATNLDDLSDLRKKHGTPASVHACHFGLVGGYVIEGHVPADSVHRLLKEKPAVAGLAVLGMPIGSPGMEGPNPQKYNVLTFDKQGKTTVFANY